MTSPAEPPPQDPSLRDILERPEHAPRRRASGRVTARSLRADDVDRDSLERYLHEVARTPLLTPEQEIAVARLARAGDEEAMQELATRNLRFVISVAKKYQNRGIPLVDLIGEGNIGLMTAAAKFDPDQGVKFISYAVWWIRQSILAALARHGRPVRVPLNRTADLARLTRTVASLREELERPPTPEELAAATGLTVSVVQDLLILNVAELRLDAPLEEGGGQALVDRFAQSGPLLDDEVLNQFLTAEIDRALTTVAPRDARVIRLYFGLNTERSYTLEEIGQMLGVTRERVRQLRDRALKQLRDGSRGTALASFAA